MGWFDEQIRQRKKSDDEIFSDSFIKMASSVFGKRNISELQDELIITKEAVEEILRFYHCNVRELPDNIENQIENQDDKLEYLLRPYGIMKREIKLKDNWYNEAFGAILAFKKDNGTPIALLPSGLSGYSYKDVQNNKKIKVNKYNADIFQDNAICFYRPLPLRKIGFKEFFDYMKDCIEIRDILFMILATGFLTLLGILSTQLTRTMTGFILQSKNLNMFYGLLFFMLCLTASRTLIASVSMLLASKISHKISIPLEAAIMMRILSLPSNFFMKYNAGDLARRAQMTASICNLLLSVGFSVVLGSLMSFLYLGQFSLFAKELVMPALIIIISMILITAVTIVLQTRLSKKVMELSAKESGMSISLISGIQKIRLAGAEKRAFAKWADIFSKQVKLTYNLPMFLTLNGGAVISNSINNRNNKTFLTTAVLLFGNILLYYIAVKNEIKPNYYFAFNIGFGLIMGSFNYLVSVSLQISQIPPMLSMLEPILTTAPELSEGKKVLSKISGKLELDNVCFRYGENTPDIINNLSLKILPGEYVAIVGKTGCGKSTLMRLLLGFEKPQKGAIYYDGEDLKTIELKSLRRMIGVVTQDGGLFQGDIYSNIVISSPQLTLNDAWEAAELAGIAEDIRAMPMGMNTLISEGSGGISGGQKQRLMIARAVAPKPKILMFDEATSALDNITQKIVSESLDSLKCTRIVIAHRLSTIRNCDRILVLDNGKIIEEGNYDELISKHGVFSSLVERQKIE
ncbi:MAG: ATP-binding cassette domain-containing protein [Synergistaceae bacterium]|nr:ATP-binding cassette domain-containing protein [Synergistaceae bacterium]